jgi:hypothetical protein
VSAHRIAAGAGAAALLLAVTPFLGWFRLDAESGSAVVSGVDASGALWVVVALGLAAAVIAWGPARAGWAPGAGVALAAVGVVALGWTAWVAVRAPVRLSVPGPGGEVTLDVTPERLPPAVVAPVCAAAVLAAGLLLARPLLRGDR